MTAMLAPLSLEWFRALQRQMAAEPHKYRRIGATDLRMVVRMTGCGAPRLERQIGLTFEDYACTQVCELGDTTAFDPDFIVEGSYDAWVEMATNIIANGRADARHTLNTLTLMDEPLRVAGTDQTRLDAFARHNYTLQEFFNGAAQLDPGGAAPRSRQHDRA
jgi:hypothetical protein